MITILYIILGISIGIGSTLIFLQERFIRERRLVKAAGESERQQSSKQLKALDEQWEQECEQVKQELEQHKQELEVLNSQNTSSDEIDLYKDNIKEQESQIVALTTENKQLTENISSTQAQLADLQAESDFHKGEIRRLKKEKNILPPDDFIILSPPGGHLLPGSVARALMKKDS